MRAMTHLGTPSGSFLRRSAFVVLAFMLTAAASAPHEISRAPAPKTKSNVKLEQVASGLDNPWGLAFLTEGEKLVTEAAGTMRICPRTENCRLRSRARPRWSLADKAAFWMFRRRPTTPNQTSSIFPILNRAAARQTAQAWRAPNLCETHPAPGWKILR